MSIQRCSRPISHLAIVADDSAIDAIIAASGVKRCRPQDNQRQAAQEWFGTKLLSKLNDAIYLDSPDTELYWETPNPGDLRHHNLRVRIIVHHADGPSERAVQQFAEDCIRELLGAHLGDLKIQAKDAEFV